MSDERGSDESRNEEGIQPGQQQSTKANQMRSQRNAGVSQGDSKLLTTREDHRKLTESATLKAIYTSPDHSDRELRIRSELSGHMVKVLVFGGLQGGANRRGLGGERVRKHASRRVRRIESM
ncbi:hypothetical protein EW146_g2334 [Bondarzewia mesenterica]|uniref:Uncharacterized protein n=1 Tax=Bondarzewia mesenterica TaxID=1095465 RepID=A0A4V3XFS5_9AGAM|nr:hypothetical protein EW146_g2334 [Bondarzewia mesenterica]